MTTSFPKVDVKGAKTYIVFRFGKFTDKVIYDPTVDMELGDDFVQDLDDDDDIVVATTTSATTLWSTTTTTTGGASAFNLNIAFMLCVAIAKFVF